MELTALQDFVTLCINHIENTDSLRYVPFVTINNHTCYYHHWSHQKVLGNCHAYGDGKKFSELLIVAWEHNILSLITNTAYCFSWSDRFAL